MGLMALCLGDGLWLTNRAPGDDFVEMFGLLCHVDGLLIIFDTNLRGDNSLVVGE